MTLIERLRLFADDPMWADHAEVPKAVVGRAADRIEALEGQLRLAAATCDKWATETEQGGWSTHQVKANRELANELRRAAS